MQGLGHVPDPTWEGRSVSWPKIEKPDEVAREAARGRSERTPCLALGGVQLTIAVAVAVVLAIALVAYALT